MNFLPCEVVEKNKNIQYMHIYKLYTYGTPCIYTVQLHLITGSLFGCFRLFRLFEAQ